MSGIIGEFGSKSGDIGSKPYAFLTLSSAQNISDNVITKITFDELNYDSHGTVDDGWVCSEAGVYQVDLQVSAHSTSNDLASIYPHVRVASTVQHGGYIRQNFSARHETAAITGIVRAASGQYIFGYVLINGTSPVVYDDSGGSYGQFTTCMVCTFIGK